MKLQLNTQAHAYIHAYIHTYSDEAGSLLQLDVDEQVPESYFDRAWVRVAIGGEMVPKRVHHAMAAMGSLLFVYGGFLHGMYATCFCGFFCVFGCFFRVIVCVLVFAWFGCDLSFPGKWYTSACMCTSGRMYATDDACVCMYVCMFIYIYIYIYISYMCTMFV